MKEADVADFSYSWFFWSFFYLVGSFMFVWFFCFVFLLHVSSGGG